jgi:hypothetical protein
MGTGDECCNAWVTYLRDEGSTVTDEERDGTPLMTFKAEVGVPQNLISCHTGMTEGYVLKAISRCRHPSVGPHAALGQRRCRSSMTTAWVW